MKLNKGLYRDNTLENQPNNTWVGGKNLMFSSKYDALENEYGHEEIISAIADLGTLIGVITTPTEFVTFVISNENQPKNSHIGVYRNGEYSIIFSGNLNLNTNYPVFGEYYYNYKQELIVVWSDNHNTPKICNIDDLPFTVSLDSNKQVIDENLLYLELFSEFKVPIFKLTEIIESGGSLKSGVYYTCIQYELPDGSFGNFSHLSNPIFIYKDSTKKSFIEIEGCESNIDTNKSFKLSISNIDTKYKRFKFGIIHKANNIYNCYISDIRTISDYYGSYILSNTEGFEAVDLSTIITKSAYYDKVEAMINIDNTLWLAGLETEKEIRYQKYANNIQVEYVYEDTVSMNGYKGSHKDPVFLFDKKSFMPGEIMALFIRFHLKGGHKVTQAFHIPGRPPVAGDITILDNNKGIHPNAKTFQLLDTCEDDGTMSYWENEDEIYPNELDKNAEDQEFNGAVDYEGNVISGGINLVGQKIRHHKFPGTQFLNENLTVLRNTQNLDTLYALSNPYTATPYTYQKALWFDNSDIPVGAMSFNNRRYTNNNVFPVTLFITPRITGTFYHTLNEVATNGVTSLKIVKNGSSELYSVSTLAASVTSLTTLTTPGISVTLNNGEYVDIVGSSITSTTGTGYATIGSFVGYVTILDQTNILAQDGTLFGTILGIKLKNVYIPQEIADKCEYYEVLYAERNNDNSTVLGQGMLYKTEERWYDGDKETDHIMFNCYDLLSTKKQFTATHFKPDGYLTSKIYDVDSIIEPYGKEDFIKITENKYVNRHSFNTTDNNTEREENIKLEYDTTELATYPDGNINPFDPLVPSYGDQNYLLVTLYNFKPNVYINYTNLKLVRTGQLIPIFGEGTFESNKIYGGDVHFNLIGFSRYWTFIHNITDDPWKWFNFSYFLYPSYSILNSGLRYSGKEPYEIYFPKVNFITNKSEITTVGREIRNRPEEETDSNLVSKGYTEWQKVKDLLEIDYPFEWQEYYSPISDNTSLNNIEPHIIFDIKNDFTNKFPYRLHKSLKQFAEGKVQSWRTLLANEYYESVSNRGKIIQLATDGNDLLILHHRGLYVVRNIQQLQVTNDIVSALGSSNLFDTKPIEIGYDKSGYVGCQSRFGVVSCIYGIFIVDREQGKIFHYVKGQIKEISNLGLEKFFSTNLQYSKLLLEDYIYYFDDGEVIEFDDEEPVEYREATTDEKLHIDNPFTQFGIYLVWDEKLTRLLLVKTYADHSGEMNEDYFTLCYYPEIEAWGWFHEYVPNYSFSNRTGLFHSSNSIVYQQSESVFRNIYLNGGDSRDISIDLVFNLPLDVDKLFQAISWVTKVYWDGVEQKDGTFNEATILNELRYSDKIGLTSDNIRLTGGTWKLSDFRDKLLDKTQQLVDLSKINIIQSLSGSPLTTNWYDNNLFIDPYIIVRLTYVKPRGEEPAGLNNTSVIFKILTVSAHSNIVTR